MTSKEVVGGITAVATLLLFLGLIWLTDGMALFIFIAILFLVAVFMVGVSIAGS